MKLTKELQKILLKQEKSFQLILIFLCRHCKFPPKCMARCAPIMYYVLHQSKTMTQVCIRLGSQEHFLVATRPFLQNKQITHDLIQHKYKSHPLPHHLPLPCLLIRHFLGLRSLALMMDCNPNCKAWNLIYCWKSFPLCVF